MASTITISVPLDARAKRDLERLEKNNPEMSRAGIVRKAIRRMTEDEAIEAVLRAKREPALYGSLDELLKKVR